MLQNKLWVCNKVLDTQIDNLSKETGISDFLARIFLSRGIDDTSFIKKFLNPSMDHFYDPFLIKDMDKAVDRIAQAVSSRKKILIYGDYDVDGITSTSIIFSFLKGQKANVEYYIPDRIDEGYGLSYASIDKIKQTDVELIITVDCGITAIDEVRYINENGIDIIITDHHECKEVLPEAYAIICPCRPDCTYPFKELAGVGVVYKLINALCIRMELGEIYKEYLEFVALGTVADVVPLIDENRVIVRYGLQRIENTKNVGLRAILDNCGQKSKSVTSWTISFVIAPRINAAGRIGNAGRAVRLFTTDDEEEAAAIVVTLNEENRYRQETEYEIMQQVIETIQSSLNLDSEKVIVASGEGWHHGIIGIVASKITELYHRPCILITNEDGMGKGSGRSIEGFDIFKALTHCSELLERYGGHELAAGLTLKSEMVPEFRKKINEYADNILTPYHLLPKVKIDIDISSGDISMSNIRELDLLAPFGAGNPGPVFRYGNIRLSDMRAVGENKHLKLKFEDNGFFVDAIGFNMGGMTDSLNVSDMLDVACTLEVNTWNAHENVQLHIKDIKASDENVMIENYYHSLEKCNKFLSMAFDDSLESAVGKLSSIDTEEELKKMLFCAVRNKEKVAILVNWLSSAKKLDAVLKNSLASVKNPHKICYTDSVNDEISLITVIINPYPDKISFNDFDHIVFYGKWISKAYLQRLMAAAGTEKSLICPDDNNDDINLNDIIPERNDLVAVYQHIKSNCESGRLVSDLFVLTRKIADSYKINMNYFKLKKCLGIFSELGLIKEEERESNIISVTLIDNGSRKTNIENSKLYMSLQNLKMQIKGA